MTTEDGQYRKGPTKDCKGTVRLSCRKLVLIELNGAFQISLSHCSVYSVAAW